MKPGRLTCAGLVGIFMVLPGVGWPASSPQRSSTVTFVVERLDASPAAPSAPLDPSRQQP